MAIVERVKGICLKPNEEWGKIAEESTPTAELFKNYVAPLAVIGPIAAFLGGSFVGRTMPFVGTYRVPIGTGLAVAVFGFVMTLVNVFILSLIIDALAPRFGGEKSRAQALKVAAYSFTPVWVAGALQLLPVLGLLALLAAFYGLYLLYLGLPRLMKCPQERATSYTVVVVLCAIAMSIVLTLISASIIAPTMMGAAALPGMPHHRAAGEVQFDKDSPMGKLQDLGRATDQSNKKMEAAQKSNDPGAQAAAAMEGLGALMGGGKRVNPVDIDQLKPFIPETFAGLAKINSNAEKSGAAGLMLSKAAATYGDRAKKSVSLDVSDTGGARGLLGLAGLAGIQGEREDDNGFERTQKVNGRLVHEKGSKHGGSNELTIVVGDRFIVSAKGHGVDLAELKTAVAAIDLGKLEAMKDVGVQK